MADDADPGEPPRRGRRGWRAFARLVDLVVLAWLGGVVLVEVGQRLLGGDPLGRRDGVIDLTSGGTVLVLAVLSLAYESVPVLWRAATPGKAMLGLAVVDADSLGRPAAWQVVFRWLALYGVWLVPVVGWALGLLVVLPLFVDPDGLGLHDRLARTVVIDDPRRVRPVGDA